MKAPTGGISEHTPRRWTPAPKRARWAKAFSASGKTHAEFAREHALGVSTLRRWVREQAGDSSPGPESVTMQEVDLGRLLGREAIAGSRRWQAEIRLPSGVVIALAMGTSAVRVRELLEAVRCRASAARPGSC